MSQLNVNVLEKSISGINLSGKNLKEELRNNANLLVFLRHFG